MATEQASGAVVGDDQPPRKKIKRTSFAPWASGHANGKSSLPSPPVSTTAAGATSAAPAANNSSKPVRIVSDIPLPSIPGWNRAADGGATSKPGAGASAGAVAGAGAGLAGRAKIKALQRQWEKQQTGTGAAGSKDASGSTGNRKSDSSPSPSGLAQKGSSPGDATPHRTTSTVTGVEKSDRSSHDSEPSVQQQLDNEMKSKSTDRADSGLNVTPKKARPTSRSGSGGSSRFMTPSELLSRIRNEANQSPATKAVAAAVVTLDDSQSTSSDSDSEDLVHLPAHNLSDALTPPEAQSDPPPTMSLEDELTYSTLTMPDGEVLRQKGMLIPPGYKLHGDPRTPFICSVRDCQRILSSWKGLGTHFSSAHSGTTFNDNGDGTVSKVGSYSRGDGGFSHGIIVSKNPIGPGAPPPAFPSLAATVQRRDTGTQPAGWKIGTSPRLPAAASPATLPSPATTTPPVSSSAIQPPKATPVPVPKPRSQKAVPGERLSQTVLNASPLLAALHQHLSPEQTLPVRDDIQYLQSFRLNRALPSQWVETHKGSVLDATDYACALAYMGGEEVPEGLNYCQLAISEANKHDYKYWEANASLSVICVRLPRGMSKSSRIVFSSEKTCVGCRYWQHRQNLPSGICKWKRTLPPLKRPEVKAPERWPIEGVPAETEPETETKDARSEASTAAAAVPKDASQKASSSTRRHIPSRDQSHVSNTSTSSNEPRTMRGRLRPSQLRSAAHEDMVQLRDDRAVRSSGQFNYSKVSMEEWEIAPGRIEDEEKTESIAFSNAYMSTTQPITVSDDVAFNVLTLSPGNNHRWDQATDQLRTCSIAAGKVDVTLGDKRFTMGPNGVFIIRPGNSCKVMNFMYQDAVLHCTTVKDYELRPADI